MGKIRGTHSSPGVYTKFTDLSYAAKTLGITTLGLVGETKMGRAFDPVMINSWADYVSNFGGTSPEKFKGTNYPKYELPYIAKSYLSKSDQLYVCRVLGLSGYNAGPAFVITASNSEENSKKYVVAVLRLRGHYEKYGSLSDACNPVATYDTLVYDNAGKFDSIKLTPYTNTYVTVNCEGGSKSATASGETDQTITIDEFNLGQFNIQPMSGDTPVGLPIPVSLNAGAKDYIYKVLGGEQDSNSSCPLFVEELYDINLLELLDKVDQIDNEVTMVAEPQLTSISTFDEFVEIPTKSLKSKSVGKVFLASKNVIGAEEDAFSSDYICVTPTFDEGGKIACYTTGTCVDGHIYEVVATDSIKGLKGVDSKYVYLQKVAADEIYDIYTSTILFNVNVPLALGTIPSGGTLNGESAIKKSNMNVYVKTEDGVQPMAGEITSQRDFNDYTEEFRCAVSPWVVSELKGTTNLEVKKLFRVYSINDGESANTQIKISISNIRPDEGTFDLVVRDYYDSDSNITVLESYRGLNMVPGDPHYIGLKIGTLDGSYEAKSKYILVDVIENDITATCVPCGFLGYPVRTYGNGVNAPAFTYNTDADEDIPSKKQYFGLSDIKGIDSDMLKYKGKNAYHDSDMSYGYTNAFHLDSTLDAEFRKQLKEQSSGVTITVTVDGDENTSGITWDTVNFEHLGKGGERPIIDSEYIMANTIYEDVKLRKFTFCLYGGFDGWDIYRSERTNGDEFKANKYKGTISNGKGRTFSTWFNSQTFGVPSNSITSDYYAYLAGIYQFANPERNIINIFATPGIDYVNNNLLVADTITMIEENRGDALYVVTTPDKPKGATDAEDEMYSPSEAAENLVDSNIDTYYGATFYPWINFYDKENFKYIYLSPTKDVVRNMADVDNKSYPWYSAAGIERGNVECRKAHIFTKVEDEDEVYDGRINPIKTFGKDGVKVWGNKTMYTGDTPMNRINVVRLMLYMRRLIVEASRKLIFDPNDATLKKQFEDIIKPILGQIKQDRGITDFALLTSQTKEQMDAHEISANIGVKPTPTLEWIEINFTVTPQGVEFEDVM